MADSRNVGAQSLVKGELQGHIAASCDRLRRVTWASNDTLGTERQSTCEFSISFAAPRNEPTGERYDQAVAI
uniref:Uncharacterized protein n=1 Tax=Mesocestoides corti TaxID=53468 RepID=A0A5K3EU94_MESCO